MPLFLAALLFSLTSYAGDTSADPAATIPVPRIHTLFLPVVTRPRLVTIEGKNFLPEESAPFQVSIGSQKVQASRVSDGEIQIPAESIGSIYRSLGKEPSRELPVKVKVNGLESNVALLAFINTSPGDIQGRVKLKGVQIPFSGARIVVPERQMKTEVSAAGAFTLRQLPPDSYKLVLEWPTITEKLEISVHVLPGQTVTADPFEVEVPKPELKSAEPHELNESQPLALSGRNFLHSVHAPYEVKLGEMTLKANRTKNELIVVPPESLLPLFQAMKPGEKREFKATVVIAGTSTKPKPITLFKLAPPREVAASSPSVQPPSSPGK